MYTALTEPRLISGIMKASPMAQTSSLEGFHSVVNQFSPKMIGYSFPGMFCRYVVLCDIIIVLQGTHVNKCNSNKLIKYSFCLPLGMSLQWCTLMLIWIEKIAQLMVQPKLKCTTQSSKMVKLLFEM